MFKTTKNKAFNAAAFSIVEAMVGMVISAIVMGLIFVIFSIVSERMIDYKNQNRLINDMNRLTYSINKDIFENKKMMVNENELAFQGYAGEQINYRTQEAYFLRISETFTDTFQIQMKQIRIDSVFTGSKKKVFQRIKIKTFINGELMELNFYKPLYANELLQEIK